MNYFVADTHFGGEYVLAREQRPFCSAREFANVVIRNFNQQVSAEDTIYYIVINGKRQPFGKISIW